MLLTCPAYGFRTLPRDHYGSYEVCPVCDWEDDAVQLANPCSEQGANRASLCECQKLAPTAQTEYDRDPEWRQLNEQEIAYFQSAKQREHWLFPGETAPEFAYWRNSPAKLQE